MRAFVIFYTAKRNSHPHIDIWPEIYVLRYFYNPGRLKTFFFQTEGVRLRLLRDSKLHARTISTMDERIPASVTLNMLPNTFKKDAGIQ
jgi:hypothetical protein